MDETTLMAVPTTRVSLLSSVITRSPYGLLPSSGTTLLLLLATAGCLDPSLPGNLVPRTVIEDAALPRFQFSDGTLVHLETIGDPARPAVLVFHGGPGGDYRGLLPLQGLADEYFVIFWDQRGAGLSQRVPWEGIASRLSSDALEIADFFSPGRPVAIVGHSWGGIYAAMFLGAFSARVHQVVLVEPGALSYALFLQSGVGSVDLSMPWLNDAQWSYGIVSTDDYAREDYAFAVAFIDQVRLQNPKPRFWRFGVESLRAVINRVLIPGYDFGTGLHGLDNPVLILAGTAPHDLGADFQALQRPLFKQVQIATIDAAGHNLLDAHPEETLAAIRTFLQNNAP